MPNVTMCPKYAQCVLMGALVLLSAAFRGGPAQAQVGTQATRPLVEVRTGMGTFIIALYNETPMHRDNFLKLVREHAYDSLLFHRAIPGLVVQGGDPESRHATAGSTLGNGGTGYTLPSEIVAGLVHTKGAVAAVRASDDLNPERRSDGSQFYVVQGKPYLPGELDMVAQRAAARGVPLTYGPEQQDRYATQGGAPHLDGAYTVFGNVVEGLEVIDAIAEQPCNGQDRPLKDIRMFMRVME